MINGKPVTTTIDVGIKATKIYVAKALRGTFGRGVINYSDDFSQISSKGFIDPKTIRFSQDDIAKNFKNGGGSIEEFAQGLKSGNITPASVEPIRLVSKDGMTFTLDNRRLWAFQQAGKNIPFIKLNSIPKNQLSKFSTPNNGISILLR